MIHGLIMRYEANEDHVLFKCPHCNKQHGLFVTTTRDKPYNNGITNVWICRDGKKMPDGKILLELNPSFDNSLNCGWHGSYHWEILAIELGPEESRDETTEKWLDCKPY